MRVAGLLESMLMGEHTICGVAHLVWSLSGPAEPAKGLGEDQDKST
jgi:hypothetical protein